MAGKTPEIPYGYGTLTSVTPGRGSTVLLWFSDPTGSIRAVAVDIADPANPRVLEGELLIRRRTEGARKRGRGALPPVGLAAESKK
jgi:hypothetical protein